MANEEQLARLKESVEGWNAWRQKNPAIEIDLRKADLGQASLEFANLRRAYLNGANLYLAYLHDADLHNANLSGTDLQSAHFGRADLSRAELRWANLITANLSGANLSGADLTFANLSRANLSGADLSGASVGGTLFVNLNLSQVKGLETVIHEHSSSLGIDTIYNSKGNIPEVFLRGCGVPENFIAHIHSLVSRPEVLPSQDVVFVGPELTSLPKLTPHYLASDFVPYLVALAEIQHVIDSTRGQPPAEVVVNSIEQYSPVTVSVSSIGDAVQAVRDILVPARRKYNATMRRLAEEEKKAEVLERHAHATKDRAEAEKLSAEATKLREEAERMKLENEKLRIELYRAKSQLAQEILTRSKPDLSETERIAYSMRLLPPLDVVLSSNIEIAGEPAKAVN